MASTIYPQGQTFGERLLVYQIKKEVTIPHNMRAFFDNGVIIAKGNVFEGIKAVY